MLISGCSAIGTQPILMDLKSLPDAVIDRIGICQMIEGDIDADGVYTNASAQAVSVVEFNGACANVNRLESRNGAVDFTNRPAG